MSLFQRKRLSLGIATDHLSLLQIKTRQYQRLSLQDEPRFNDAPQGLLTALSQLLDQQTVKGGKVDAIVADCWARYWLVEPPANANSLTELKACTNERFKQLFGANPDDWRVMANWHPIRPFLATALPSWLCDGLRQECNQHNITLRSCMPLFVQQWHLLRRHVPSDTWLCIEQASSLVIALMERGELRHVRMLTLPPSPSNDSLLFLLEQEVVRCRADASFYIPNIALHLGPTQRWPQAVSAGSLRISSLAVPKHLEGLLTPSHSAEGFSDGVWLALAGCTS